MGTLASAQTTKQTIAGMLDDLPPESLKVVEQFVRFLRQQGPVVAEFRYPTVSAPASSLNTWAQLLKEGYEGNALADTEDLYK